VEKLVYTNITTEAEKEVPAYPEKEPAYTNETEDEPQRSTPVQSDEQEEKDDDLPDESELDDIIQKRLLGLLDEIVDFDEDEDEKEDKDDEGNKGKGHKHNDDD
jgi:hypothetical protein